LVAGGWAEVDAEVFANFTADLVAVHGFGLKELQDDYE